MFTKFQARTSAVVSDLIVPWLTIAALAVIMNYLISLVFGTLVFGEYDFDITTQYAIEFGQPDDLHHKPRMEELLAKYFDSISSKTNASLQAAMAAVDATFQNELSRLNMSVV
jgi:hypothetical protein